MDANRDQTTAVPGPETADPQFCVYCDYNLTGLRDNRCPECGRTIEPGGPPPQIAFERRAGWSRCAGFVLSWLDITLRPWAFGRQAVQRVSGRHAAAFGGICFAATLLSVFFGASASILLSWWVVASVYLLLQATLLSSLDVANWSRWGRSWCWWLAVGGYTSTVVVSEFAYGPPLILLSELPQMFGRASGLSSGGSGWGNPNPLQYVQMIVWTTGLSFIFAARMRRAQSPLLTYLMAAAAWLLVWALYATTIEHVGAHVHRWIEGWLGDEPLLMG